MKSWTTLLGWLGVVFLVFAVLTFLVEIFSSGIVLGAPLLAQFPWSLANLALGALLVAIALSANIEGVRQRLRSGEARRASKYGASAILGTLLVVALFSAGAFLSVRYSKRWDFTKAKIHSLSEQTQKVLAGLKEPVHITALFPAAQHDGIGEFLEKFELAAPDKVQLEMIDPQNKPGRLRELGISSEALAGGVLHLKVGAESTEVKELSEQAITNAIVKLTRREVKRVYVLIDHNERAIDGDAAKEPTGFGQAALALKNENYQVDPLLLAASKDVPSDAQVVVIAGPTRPYHETEHAALGRYLANGGSLLVMLDPGANTDLVADLAKWGVTVGDDVIVDLVQAMNGSPYTPFAEQYGDHEITRGLRVRALFPAARSVKATTEGGDIQSIVTTGEQSWAESDFQSLKNDQAKPDPATEIVGFVPVAVAGEAAVTPAEGKTRGRLVVVGDSDFATNQWLGQFGNRDLFLNAVNWLLRDPAAISIRPPQPGTNQLSDSAAANWPMVRIGALFVIPELIAVLGVIAWWRRRRAPGR